MRFSPPVRMNRSGSGAKCIDNSLASSSSLKPSRRSGSRAISRDIAFMMSQRPP